MDNQSHLHQMLQSHQSFWKKSSQAVPGRLSLKQDYEDEKNFIGNTYANPGCTRIVSGGPASFQDFQESINDAWDLGDDEFCLVSDIKISKKVSESAALNVINHHRSSTIDASPQTTNRENNHYGTAYKEKKTEVLQKPAAQPHYTNSTNLSTNILKQNLSIDKVNKTITLPNVCHHRYVQYPGRPQPLRQPNTSGKFFIPSKGQDGESKIDKFKALVETSLLNLDDLRQLSWSGIPAKLRSITWRLLSEYLPASFKRRQHVLERKRLDYWNLVKQYYDTERDEGFQDTYRQIHIDIPRMSPLISIFQQSTVQIIFERILYIWAIRHPASGYVQVEVY
ncbi:TBC1 domain family member 22B [Copidosoma floridanum]|uniref:TBC1 domain family member 22B n=1 Tax=Copidosoma floridanum TaxID=29053 RepID=UPI0006C93F3E|nr:TBC1 domain family member 22B [Copidosoma floridanum]